VKTDKLYLGTSIFGINEIYLGLENNLVMARTSAYTMKCDTISISLIILACVDIMDRMAICLRQVGFFVI